MIHLTEDPIDLAALLQETEDPDCGALVVFGGSVRVDNGVEAIDYTAYAPLAIKNLHGLEIKIKEKFEDVRQCRLIHRTGLLKVGEFSVYVVVRAGHREQAFAAARWAIDQLKACVPVFKHQHFTDGSREYLAGQPMAAL